MKNIVITLLVLLASNQALACAYSITINYELSQNTICADGLKIQQTSQDLFKVTFANYVPGTKIPYQKVNFHFNGKKESVETKLLALHSILKNHDAGNLYFDQAQKFVLVSNKESNVFTQEASDLVNSINPYLR